MGSQPGTLMTGLTAATPTADAAAPSSTITAPAADSTIAPGSQVTVTRHRHGRRWRRRRRRRGLDRRRHHLAPRHPAAERGPTRGPRGARARSTLRSRAADDSGNIETPSAGVTVTVGERHPVLPVQHLAQQRHAGGRIGERHQRARGGREVPRRRGRPGDGAALLQGRGQHRHARRPSVDPHRHAARHGHLHERDARRAGSRSTSPRRSPSPPTPPTSRPTTRRTGATRSTRTTSRRPASTRRRCTR